MNRILAFLEGKLAPLGERIGKQRHLKALREGIMMAMPLVLLGSFFVLVIKDLMHIDYVAPNEISDLF